MTFTDAVRSSVNSLNCEETSDSAAGGCRGWGADHDQNTKQNTQLNFISFARQQHYQDFMTDL